MATFDFTGADLTDSNAGLFTGGTTVPGGGVNFTFSYNTAFGTGSFIGGDLSISSSFATVWNATLTLSAASSQTFSGVNFTTAGVTSFNVTTGGTVVGPGLSQIVFTFSGTGGSLAIQSFDAVCFLAGTKIATKTGSKPVESLQPGDRILTAGGTETTVKWLGRQLMDVQIQHPAKINPICISASAIAEGVPACDLFVSPDHAIEIDGMLINASALVNGSTVYQVAKMPLDGFTYYHVETDAHEVILAEGCPAESYLDVPDRSAFINGEERSHVAPIQEMDLPRVSSKRLVPAKIAARLKSWVRKAA